jgi:GxxExxY protein
MLISEQLTEAIFGSRYEKCLCPERDLCGLNFRRQLELPLAYQGMKLDGSSRLDVLVKETVRVKLKGNSAVVPISSRAIADLPTSKPGKKVGGDGFVSCSVFLRGSATRW